MLDTSLHLGFHALDDSIVSPQVNIAFLWNLSQKAPIRQSPAGSQCLEKGAKNRNVFSPIEGGTIKSSWNKAKEYD